MRILFIGDIVGGPGRRVLENNLTVLEKEENIDFTIANGENSSGGFGMNKKGYEAMSASGVDAFTMGNHTFDNKKILDFIDTPNLVRPLNLQGQVPGSGLRSIKLKNGGILTIVNLLGRVYSNCKVDCPFHTMDNVLKEHSLSNEIIILDFHADATSEKVCMGHYLDGRVSAVLGTHTHIQTADEKILPRGTGYITDVGMTGAYDSSLGMDKETAVKRFIPGINAHLFPAEGERQINAVVLEIDDDSHKTKKIKRINLLYPGEF
ncbi:MAG: TIGR00282 family metallophosphoesterase [Bacillota bacterium]|nr:TIGR00282 family metallophosphoesterase [Bacillota bacterium]